MCIKNLSYCENAKKVGGVSSGGEGVRVDMYK